MHVARTLCISIYKYIYEIYIIYYILCIYVEQAVNNVPCVLISTRPYAYPGTVKCGVLNAILPTYSCEKDSQEMLFEIE